MGRTVIGPLTDDSQCYCVGLGYPRGQPLVTAWQSLRPPKTMAVHSSGVVTDRLSLSGFWFEVEVLPRDFNQTPREKPMWQISP